MFKRLWKKEDGQVLVMVALLLFVLLGFAALVIDVGYYYGEKRQLQTAVDAGALAGTIVAKEEQSTQNKGIVDIEVNNYLYANVGETTAPDNIDVKWTDPVSVDVKLTTKHPTFFARIFNAEPVNIYAYAKAEAYKIGVSDYTIFAEGIKVELSGNKPSIYGEIYSNQDPKISPPKLLEDLVIDVGSPYPPLPDYTGVKDSSVTDIGIDDFNTTYVDGTGKVAGLINIKKDSKGVKIQEEPSIEGEGVLEGVGIIYTTGDMEINVVNAPGSSILYYSDGNITISGSDAKKTLLYGIVYAPNGSITINGNPNIVINGKLLAKNSVFLNGGKFTLGKNEDAEDWMPNPLYGSRLIK